MKPPPDQEQVAFLFLIIAIAWRFKKQILLIALITTIIVAFGISAFRPKMPSEPLTHQDATPEQTPRITTPSQSFEEYQKEMRRLLQSEIQETQNEHL